MPQWFLIFLIIFYAGHSLASIGEVTQIKGNGVTVVGLTSTKNLHVTGISSLVTLDVGTVTSGLVVSGGSTIAGISSINTIHVGNGGTTFTVTGDGTFAIGSATTTVAATLNGGSIPSIGLVIALGG